MLETLPLEDLELLNIKTRTRVDIQTCQLKLFFYLLNYK